MPYKKDVKRETYTAMSVLAKRLISALRHGSQRKSITTKRGKITYQEFYPASTKPILDEIDAVLADHYKFTAEEFDFIVNYDIKYRMSADDGNEE